MKSKKIILSLITLTILVSFVPTKANAKSNANNKTIVVNSEKNNESGLSENLKKKVDPFILVENNRFVARIPDSIKATLSESDLNKVNMSVKIANDQLNNLTIKKVNGNVITVIEKNKRQKRQASSYYEGVTSFDTYWWGAELYLSRGALYEIADLVNKGAFHASRLGVIVGGVTVGYFTSGLGAKIGTAVCTYIANQLLPGMPELDPYSSNTYRPIKIKTTWLLQVSHSYQ